MGEKQVKKQDCLVLTGLKYTAAYVFSEYTFWIISSCWQLVYVSVNETSKIMWQDWP